MKKVFNLIIVDESGSMESIRKPAFSGINETLQTILIESEKHEMEQRVSLMTFDDGHQTFIYDNVPAERAIPLVWNQYQPLGCTPLYDAIGKGISRINALTTPEDSVLVTIITDGYENASREFTLGMIKNLIEKLKKEHWTFTLIGTNDLDVEGMGDDLSIKAKFSFAKDEEGMRRMWKKERAARRYYNHMNAQGIDFNEDSYFNVDENGEFGDDAQQH